MPRHEPRRGNRWLAENERNELESLMKTYDEAILEDNSAAAGFSFPSFLFFPVPNKVNELEAIKLDDLSSRKSAFFIKRPDANYNGNSSTGEESPPRSAENEEEASDETTESESDEATKKRRAANDATLFQSYWFCLRQLFFSRLWILLLQFIAAYYAGERFRRDAFNLADRTVESGKSVVGDLVVRRALRGLRRWDAQHFLFIADNHYLFEQSLAFFAGFPEVVNVIRIAVQEYMIYNFGWSFPIWVLTGLIAFLMNFVFFILGGFMLFTTVYTMTKSMKQALLATSVFAYNPASIFFTAAYSESMFFTMTLTSFGLMLFALHGNSYLQRITGAFLGATCFGLTFLIRSNGLLNVIFVAWYWCGTLLWVPETSIPECSRLKKVLSESRNDKYRREVQAGLREFEKKRKKLRKVFRWTEPGFSRCTLVITVFVFAILAILSFFTPYVFMSNAVANDFCGSNPHQKALVAAIKKKVRLPSNVVTHGNAWEKTTWCRKPKILGLFSTYYGEIQAKYWDVGLFGYWQLKKIPCFLLMLPAAILTFLAIRKAWRNVFEEKRWNNIWVLTIRSDHFFPLAIHASIMLFVAIFYINAEVFTRLMFSSSPLLYIYIAQYIDKLTEGNTPGNRHWHYTTSPGLLPFFVFKRVWQDGWRGKALYIYILGYYIFGTMAHAAWLPFT